MIYQSAVMIFKDTLTSKFRWIRTWPNEHFFPQLSGEVRELRFLEKWFGDLAECCGCCGWGRLGSSHSSSDLTCTPSMPSADAFLIFFWAAWFYEWCYVWSIWPCNLTGDAGCPYGCFMEFLAVEVAPALFLSAPRPGTPHALPAGCL